MNEHETPQTPASVRGAPLRLVLGLAAVVGVTAWLAGASPWSPLALQTADAALGQGRPDLAVERYDEVARYNPFTSVRRRALLRAASVWAVDLRDPAQARLRLRRFLRHHPDSDEVPGAWARMGDLLLHHERRPRAAARAYAKAAEVEPLPARAAEFTLRAARAHLSAGQLEAAARGFESVAEGTGSSRHHALLGLAETQLAAGDAQAALGTYEIVADEATDADLASIARLGASACLERLGNLEEALAELDLADLPQGVAESRRDALEARRGLGGTF